MNRISFLFVLASVLVFNLSRLQAWQSDNGNGTFTNPLFYDEFSDPDMIRVGDDFYLTGTTMHVMPGLPVLHSKDLVNWEFLGYAFDKLDLGPEFRLEKGRSVYGQGIWAPCLRYHDGKFYIFSNINGRNTQLFTATNPAGPWQHTELKHSFHDLSVLFDDDGKVYVVWGYKDIHLAQLTDDLKDMVPGTERSLFPPGSGMGEGSHFYKINGKYFITSAWWDGRMRMACARADKPEGPYEVNPAISVDESYGLAYGCRLRNEHAGPPFQVDPPDTTDGGRLDLHQGGLVQTIPGEWWGFSMMDNNSLGRTTSLSPITWTNGWPYFGLPGNLGRTPRTWVKPDTGDPSHPGTPYQRNDDFSGPQLANVWQWNHVPDDSRWSLAERPGYLRLHSLPATDFWRAKNTLTQRAIGPESIPTAKLDASGLKPGDVAGLALLDYPHAWIGVRCRTNGLRLEQFTQLTGETQGVPLSGTRVWLRAHCDFLAEKATFSYSTDGKKFLPLGAEFTTLFQMRTFQGVRYSLFNFNSRGTNGGYADFDSFTVDEPRPHGLMRPIPFGKTIIFTNRADGTLLAVANETRFHVVDLGLGRVALKTPAGFVSVNAANGQISLKRGRPGVAETYQWMETLYGDTILLSLATDRYVQVSRDGNLAANSAGPKPDRQDGSCFVWR
ncbi:MAG TPA: glycoside hydrolase 43 family protein [Verrucomicrobiae bacterium]